MRPMAIGWLVFACVFGGALVGMLFRRILPENHLSTESKDVVKLGMGLIATMCALVLGLLIASAKGSFDAQKTEFTQMSANFIQLDRTLARYGAETKDARAVLRQIVTRGVEGNGAEGAEQLDSAAIREGSAVFIEKIQDLSPKDDVQRSLRSQALQIAIEIGRTRSLLLEQGGSSIPMPFLVVLVCWIAILFMSFGLFAPVNSTVIFVLCVCALSVSSAIFLILELDQPFGGLIQISNAPLRNALAHLGR